jgi:hypothetical protein
MSFQQIQIYGAWCRDAPRAQGRHRGCSRRDRERRRLGILDRLQGERCGAFRFYYNALAETSTDRALRT